MIVVRGSRWRLRFVLRLPGPLVLLRDQGGSRGRVTKISTPRAASPSVGFLALFCLAWLGVWHWRHHKNGGRVRRHPPTWMIWCGLVAIIIALVVVI